MVDCQEQGVVVRALTNIFDLQQRDVNSGELEVTHVATYGNGLFEGWPLVFKRLLDIVASAASLILFAPILLSSAILVKLDSPGPIFFVQERVGLNKRKFRMYKFRTMVANAAERQHSLKV